MRARITPGLIAGAMLSIATFGGALAQQPGERTGEQIPPSAHTQRLYECRALARAHNFGFHFIRKGRFMRACLAQRTGN